MAIYNDSIKQAQDMNVELNISGVVTEAGELSRLGTLTGDIEENYYKT